MNQILPEDVRETTPTIFVVFGATGDLALRKLLPALHDLYLKEKLPLRFEIVAFARRPFEHESFRNMVKEEIVGHQPDVKHLDEFLKRVRYAQGLFENLESYEKLGALLSSIDEKEFNVCSNKLFYLAVPPTFYETIVTHLSSSGLTIPCGGNAGWTRVLIEKPFGNNLAEAERLDLLLGRLFKEEQIFRIDHYLAKETIRNIIAFRFGNSLFEPLWSHEHIEKMEIELYESGTVGGRGSFYDAVGALRDVGQNHLLQMFSLVSMERPESLLPREVQSARARALENLKNFNKTGLSKVIKRMRYKGFLDEKGVAQDSTTETYFSICVGSRFPRWRGVPFYIRSGKALLKSEALIRVYFKNASPLVKKENGESVRNIITFRIQPNEGVDITFAVKRAGLTSVVEEHKLSFDYRQANGGAVGMDAYEKVLVDAVRGDGTLFISTDEMKAEWKFIMPILETWRELPISEYEKGTDPAELREAE